MKKKRRLTVSYLPDYHDPGERSGWRKGLAVALVVALVALIWYARTH